MTSAIVFLLLSATTAKTQPSPPTSPAPSADAPGFAGPMTSIPFRTDAQPRIDPVFGDAAALRAAVDRFLSLQADMERVRDEFGSAVHDALATLSPTAAAPVTKSCPATSGGPYARALAAGMRYLALGQQLQSRYRDIRRADDFGDSVALTPDYRVKIKKARELYQQLLNDYREMRVAFYDQLGAEMRHAGCRTGAKAPASLPPDAVVPPTPTDPEAWSLDDALPEVADDRRLAPAAALGASKEPAPKALAIEIVPLPARSGSAAPAIWIDVDNSLCPQPTRIAIDGQALGEIGPRKKTSVRTHAGPRELCVLPAGDPRACGDAGTIRKAYLHEGWSLAVHCER
jgi:hypothetical protein